MVTSCGLPFTTADRRLAACPHPHDVLIRALMHLLFLRTPRLRRSSTPTARVARALQLPPLSDHLRLLHGTTWIAETRHIPGPPGRS